MSLDEDRLTAIFGAPRQASLPERQATLHKERVTPRAVRPTTPPTTRVARARAARMPVDSALAFVFATLVFTPFLVGEVANVRLVTIVWATAAFAFQASRRSRRASVVASVVALWAFVVLLLWGQLRLAGAHSYVVERLFFVLPVGMGLGYLVTANGRLRVWARLLVIFGLVNSVLAVYEQHLGRSIFGRTARFALMERDGGTRALLASDHSLVLGAVIAACIPLLAVGGFEHRRLLSIVLLVGTWETGSRGPTIIAVAIAATYLFSGTGEWVKRQYASVQLLVVVGLTAIGYLGLFVWSPTVDGQTGADYSTSYRTALYATLPKIVAQHPFGYGIDGLPANTWLINSGLFGVRDLATTIDSETVIWASEFGIVGLAIYLFAVWVSTAAIGSMPYVGMAASSVTFTGLFLALSSWDSLGPLWYFLVGAAIYAWRLRSTDGHQLLLSSTQGAAVPLHTRPAAR